MAHGGVTFTEVDEAARYLQGQGRNPTVDAIRERLGTGSRTTLAEHLKRWKSLQTNAVEGNLPQPLQALVTGLWDGLQSRAEQRIVENQAASHQEISALKTQLQTASQTESQLNRELHRLQEQLDTEQREKAALQIEYQALEKMREKLDMQHKTALQQIEEAKLENGRLHKLASQIQANLEHYQQAIQQQQVEYNLKKEKQHAAYTQELEQLKIALEEIRKQHDLCEKELTDKRQKLEKALADHDKLSGNYAELSTKNQQVERTLIQLQAHELSWEKYREETQQALFNERQLTQSLSQQVSVLTEQLQRAQKDLQKAEDKTETLRHEKMFLVQEKGQLDGALKQLQKANGVG